MESRKYPDNYKCLKLLDCSSEKPLGYRDRSWTVAISYFIGILSLHYMLRHLQSTPVYCQLNFIRLFSVMRKQDVSNMYRNFDLFCSIFSVRDADIVCEAETEMFYSVY